MYLNNFFYIFYTNILKLLNNTKNKFNLIVFKSISNLTFKYNLGKKIKLISKRASDSKPDRDR